MKWASVQPATFPDRLHQPCVIVQAAGHWHGLSDLILQ